MLKIGRRGWSGFTDRAAVYHQDLKLHETQREHFKRSITCYKDFHLHTCFTAVLRRTFRVESTANRTLGILCSRNGNN